MCFPFLWFVSGGRFECGAPVRGPMNARSLYVNSILVLAVVQDRSNPPDHHHPEIFFSRRLDKCESTTLVLGSGAQTDYGA